MASETEKLKRITETSQEIGEFLEWLRGTKKVVLAKWVPHMGLDWDQLVPLLDEGRTEALLAEYFTIDLSKIEKEKQTLLKEIRERLK